MWPDDYFRGRDAEDVLTSSATKSQPDRLTTGPLLLAQAIEENSADNDKEDVEPTTIRWIFVSERMVSAMMMKRK